MDGGDPAILQFFGLETLTDDTSVYLVDHSLSRLTDLRDRSDYSFYSGKREVVAEEGDSRFSLILGSLEFVALQVDSLPKAPRQFILHQNHPNPLTNSTLVRFDVPRREKVDIRIYDVCGEIVKTVYSGPCDPGRYEIDWDTRDEHGRFVASGVYFCRMSGGDKSLTRKFVLVR